LQEAKATGVAEAESSNWAQAGEENDDGAEEEESVRLSRA
jgi:hypothetical protein